jgi:membrane protein YqaA with SNARE-associated domain
MDFLSLGYLGLFLLSFFAATIVPISSEGLLAIMLTGDFNPSILLIVASSGNILGGLSSYGLGLIGNWTLIEKYLKTKKEKVLKYQEKIEKYGSLVAFFTWLPFIGDILAIGLGFFRVSFIKSLIFMSLGKTLRYAVIIYFI